MKANGWRNSWTVYSLGLGVAWAIILPLAWWLDSKTVFHSVLLVFSGFFIGWLSGTIKVALIRRG